MLSRRMAGLFGMVVALGMLAACGAPAPRSAPQPTQEESEPMTEATQRPRAVAGSTAEAVNLFGVDLLRELGTDGENVVISPLSVAIALSMLSNGADGDGLAELERALYVNGSEDDRNAELATLLKELAAGEDVDVRIAQSLWTMEGFPFRPEYIERVRDTFQAALEEVDLGSQASADQIDAWVAENTEGLIDKIAADLGLPDGAAVLVLLNATYFHGTWALSFDPDDTVPRPFETASGSVRTPFLTHHDEHFGYSEDPRRQLLRLPYGANGRFVMDLYLPRPGVTMHELAAEIPDDSAPPRTELDVVAIPKLKLEWQRELTPVLQALGVQRVWSTGSLGRMSPAAGIALSTVVHKTYLEVDEKGTKAAAATGAVVDLSARIGGPSFIADRPYAFAIRDTRTGVVMFSGVVNDPTA
jgi:serine protease inhibitor